MLTTRPRPNSDVESRKIASLSPSGLTLALSRSEREQDPVTIEDVRLGEATVSDYVASRFAGPSALTATQRLRQAIGSLLGTCRRLAALREGGRRTVGSARRPGPRSDEDPERLTISYYYPWGYFHPVRSGAAAVASRHLDYFRERGHRVRMMVRAGPHRGRSAFERHYHWVDDIAVVDVRRYPDARACLSRWDFGSYLAGHARLADKPEIRDWLSQPADVAFLNYVFATPLLDALPTSAYRVLETYDLMSHQFLEHRGSPELVRRLLDCEFDLYRLYNSVLMLNHEEAQCAQEHGVANLVYVPPSVDLVPEGDEQVAHYDILFVGSDHAPNVEGVNWFYDHVFRPLLKPRGLRWAICGSVCRKLRFKDPAVIRLASVADLGQVYRRSKVVIVPLFRGSGVSLKTLEAMGHRKPVVTTPCGRRGLPASADGAFIAHCFEDDPAVVADTIYNLCSSQALQRDYGQRAATHISAHFGTGIYDRRMNRIFACVHRKRRAPASLPAQVV
jgi:glycosyltransferase involved in cell wall biosynthesis